MSASRCDGVACCLERTKAVDDERDDPGRKQPLKPSSGGRVLSIATTIVGAVDRRIQLLCAWCGPVSLLLFVVGFWFVAGLVPPPSAADGAMRIAHFYRANTSQLRLGLLLAMIATPLTVPFIVLLTQQLKRSDGRLAPLAYTQLICGTVLMFQVLLSVVLMAVAAFRPDRAPGLTQLLNDTAFTMFLWAFSPATLEYAVVGIAVLADRSERPLFGKWVGYFDLAVAGVFLAGAPTLFYKQGVFGWDGALAFWAVLGAAGLWITVTFMTMIRAIERQPEPA